MTEQKVVNIIRDLRKDIRYKILASRKLTRDEMLRCVRIYNYDPLHLKIKSGEEITIDSEI